MLLDFVVQKYGKLDILVNNAGKLPTIYSRERGGRGSIVGWVG